MELNHVLIAEAARRVAKATNKPDTQCHRMYKSIFYCEDQKGGHWAFATNCQFLAMARIDGDTEPEEAVLTPLGVLGEHIVEALQEGDRVALQDAHYHDPKGVFFTSGIFKVGDYVDPATFVSMEAGTTLPLIGKYPNEADVLDKEPFWTDLVWVEGDLYISRASRGFEPTKYRAMENSGGGMDDLAHARVQPCYLKQAMLEAGSEGEFDVFLPEESGKPVRVRGEGGDYLAIMQPLVFNNLSDELKVQWEETYKELALRGPAAREAKAKAEAIDLVGAGHEKREPGPQPTDQLNLLAG